MLLRFKANEKNIVNLSEIIKELHFEKMIVVCNNSITANLYADKLSLLIEWQVKRDIDRTFLYKDNKKIIFYFNEDSNRIRGHRVDKICLFGKFKKDFVELVACGLCAVQK